MAAKLVRYDLGVEVTDAVLEEGDSPTRAHVVLDEFSSEGHCEATGGSWHGPKHAHRRREISDSGWERKGIGERQDSRARRCRVPPARRKQHEGS